MKDSIKANDSTGYSPDVEPKDSVDQDRGGWFILETAVGLRKSAQLLDTPNCGF